MVDAEELDCVLSGSDEIDVDDWERNSKFTANLIEHPVRGWFWELVREMPNEYRRRLLQFSTGSSRVPHGGFASLTSYDGRLCPFMLKGVKIADSGEYIHSHACFNRLDLPQYTKKKDLKAMLYGILDSDIHGFTTA
jgi:hypothetical protein